MEKEKFKEIFLQEIEKNDLSFEKVNIEFFYEYMIGILEWNQKINLTSIVDEKEFIVKHFIDSLTVCKYIQDNDKIIDIGTGAGFPGIPIKLMYRNTAVTLIDAVNKKLNVIKDITEKMHLSQLEILHTRAEDLAIQKGYRECYDIATTRAVSNLSTILEYMLPFLKIGGKAICMKGPSYEEEWKNSQKAMDILGGKMISVENRKISGNLERNILIIEKIKQTPKIYPRGKGKPLKEPIM